MPFLNQQKGENDCRKYFWNNLHERMLPTSWSPFRRRIQLCHRGRLDLDNINGHITILNQILISMHIANLVKRPCYLVKLSSGNGNMCVSGRKLRQNLTKFCPLAIPIQISLMSMHIARFRPCSRTHSGVCLGLTWNYR